LIILDKSNGDPFRPQNIILQNAVVYCDTQKGTVEIKGDQEHFVYNDDLIGDRRIRDGKITVDDVEPAEVDEVDITTGMLWWVKTQRVKRIKHGWALLKKTTPFRLFAQGNFTIITSQTPKKPNENNKIFHNN